LIHDFTYSLSLLAKRRITKAALASLSLIPSASLRLGTTFSQLQCRYIGINYREAFRQICSLGFKRIRLCSYWNEIEPQENQFVFSTLDWLLEESERHGIDVVLAVGMKVPRWPEFHFPKWVSERYETGSSELAVGQRCPVIAEHAIRFIDVVVNHTRNASAIQYWQIENEPFTRLGITGGRFLSGQFVQQEVDLIRRLALPQQKILLTGSIMLPFADSTEDEAAFQDCLSMADAVGINVYSKVPIGQSSNYLEPEPPFWQTLQTWQSQLTLNGKEAWIAEAQAEPWEPNQLVALNGVFHPSSSPSQAIDLVQRLTALNYRTILLWGCEYWYWHYRQGRPFWWNTMRQLLEANLVDNS
jgi:hypothetical protein